MAEGLVAALEGATAGTRDARERVAGAGVGEAAGDGGEGGAGRGLVFGIAEAGLAGVAAEEDDAGADGALGAGGADGEGVRVELEGVRVEGGAAGALVVDDVDARVGPAHEEIVAGVPEIPLEEHPKFEAQLKADKDPERAPILDEVVGPVVVIPKQEFAALMYAMVTGFTNGWVRMAALTKLGTMLGGQTHAERLAIWEDMKQTHLSKEGNQ